VVTPGIAIPPKEQPGFSYRQGPRCHLRLTVRMAVEDRGRRLLPVRGNPASITVEGDLPPDGRQRFSGSSAGRWCGISSGTSGATGACPGRPLRVTADGGASLTVPGLNPKSPHPLPMPCTDRGRPSVIAGWP
jgi:hypothetical protein